MEHLGNPSRDNRLPLRYHTNIYYFGKNAGLKGKGAEWSVLAENTGSVGRRCNASQIVVQIDNGDAASFSKQDSVASLPFVSAYTPDGMRIRRKLKDNWKLKSTLI